MVQISEVKGNSRENRTAAHTHIKGLGLRPDGVAEKQMGGFVGQTAAREVKINLLVMAFCAPGDSLLTELQNRHAVL